MWKRLAIAVLFASIMPVYGEQKGPKPSGDQKNSQGTQGETTVPPMVATYEVKQEGASIECQWPHAAPEGYFKRLFSPENTPNIALFFVGLGGVIAAVCTLRIIGRQAREATLQRIATHNTLTAIRRQADLMKQSADISRGATVPTLRMLNFDMGGSDQLVDHEMELTVRNYGATPAILDALYISFDEGERWPTGEGESVPYSDPGGRAVAANSEVVIQSSPYICLVSPDLIHRFRREQRSIYVHGRLRYRDVFDSPARNLRFDIHLNPTQNGTIRCDITGQWNEYDKPQNPN